MRAIKDKKPVQLKLASMSNHWPGNPISKSGKHHSQQVQAMRRRLKRLKHSQQSENQ